jgi:8-oxo-dGTP pyrophosphatase MutT (NUDIX family)
VRVRRSTGRVLPVDAGGRVLLQLGKDAHRRRDFYWLSIGGGAEPGEPLAQAAAREMREETGIDVEPAVLGQPIGTTVVEYAAFGMLPVTQYQTYFAFACDAEVSEGNLGHQSLLERLGIHGHEWLTAEELDGRPERLADPGLPRLMRAAVAAVLGPC